MFGAAAVAFGITVLAWHVYNDRDLLRDVWGGHGVLAFVYVVAAAQTFGGIALQFRRVASMGAVVLGAVYLRFAILWVLRIVATPQTYDLWGNFFEQFALVIGATFVYASMSPAWKSTTVNRIGGMMLGLCAASFAAQQGRHLSATVSLVPKWLPPNQMFWATVTTIGFAFAALALFTNRLTLLATRSMTLMIVIFGLAVWVPLLASNPGDHENWGETIETFAIAGAAWIFADRLRKNRIRETPRQPSSSA